MIQYFPCSFINSNFDLPMYFEISSIIARFFRKFVGSCFRIFWLNAIVSLILDFFCSGMSIIPLCIIAVFLLMLNGWMLLVSMFPEVAIRKWSAIGVFLNSFLMVV